MRAAFDIRESQKSDLALINALYPKAFPEEDLLPLVMALLQEEPLVLSLVGVADTSVLAHVIFTRCSLADSRREVALLGPLGVLPAFQRQGLGSALVRTGLRQMEDAGASQVYVLGDPAYYGRLGFHEEPDVAPPFPLPSEWRGAWQSISLGSAGQPGRDKLVVPEPWFQPALWSP